MTFRFAVRAAGGGLALLLGAACSSAGLSHQECNCPAGVGVATVELCGAIVSATATPDPACTVQETSGSLEITSDVTGTCHVEVAFASGVTLSTDIDFTSSWLSCGSDPHGCGQQVSASPAAVALGACEDTGAPVEAGAD